MAFFRQYVAPLIILLVFLFALVAVTARSFLPGDMLEPAVPIGQVTAPASPEQALPPQLSQLVHGDAPAL
jgi:hypothetical protein